MGAERTKPLIPPTQGVGIWLLAQEYWQAGSSLTNAVPVHSFVRYQLYGQAIELALKAFLVSQGVTERDLRKLGHDLPAALKKAEEHEEFANASLSETDIGIIEWLSTYYKAKDFSYLRTGYSRLPPLDLLTNLAGSLLTQVKPLIWRSVKLHIARTVGRDSSSSEVG